MPMIFKTIIAISTRDLGRDARDHLRRERQQKKHGAAGRSEDPGFW
jgi:hypothetical protein